MERRFRNSARRIASRRLRCGSKGISTGRLGTYRADLTDHYTNGVKFFHDEFVPHLKRTLQFLSGGVWRLDDFVAYAAGTDVDFMTHLIEAVAVHHPVALFPGDWFSFMVGCTQTPNIHWRAEGQSELACLCIPSVRNGHLTEDMLPFLTSSNACLLNLNLFPTLVAAERRAIGEKLLPVLDRSVLSISFSRGFGLTASQLGVALIHRDHPYRARFHQQWSWFTNFFNAFAARAFMLLDLRRIQEIDKQRRAWVNDWLTTRGLPVVQSGSYYVKCFRPTGDLPAYLAPLHRDEIVRFCLKPSIYAHLDGKVIHSHGPADRNGGGVGSCSANTDARNSPS